jgi:hypothetical protein
VRPNFKYNTRLELRDNSGSIARDLNRRETPRSRPTTRIAREASRMNVTYYAGIVTC